MINFIKEISWKIYGKPRLKRLLRDEALRINRAFDITKEGSFGKKRWRECLDALEDVQRW